MKSVYTFLDYRDYLKDVYESRKEKNNLYSYRVMAGGMGMDASYLAKVLLKGLHLGPKQIQPSTQYLKLSIPEAEYFQLLVDFSKSKSLVESEVLFARLSELRPITFRCLEAKQFEIFGNWTNVALRSLLGVARFHGSHRELGSLLEPEISTSQVKEAIKLLTSLNLIRSTDSDDLEPCEAHLGTGSVFRPVAVREFQRQVCHLQAEALDRFPKEERDISTLTFAADEKALQDIREILRSCRRAIQKRMDDVIEPNRIFELNLGLFPLSKTIPPNLCKDSSK